MSSSGKSVLIGLIGDLHPSIVAHQAIPKAIGLNSEASGCSVGIEWVPTPEIESAGASRLEGLDALWCVPGSPYASMEGALAGIRYARERGVPFLGTCGGFQHALLEYARNRLGLREADHAESRPEAELALISPLTCSLVGKSGEIQLREGSRIRSIYGTETAREDYHCNYGFNPRYAELFQGQPMRISGMDLDGDARVIELEEHPFFIATLFQPERSALRDRRHPLVEAWLRAAAR